MASDDKWNDVPDDFVLPAGDAKRGAKLFKKHCQQCHSMRPDNRQTSGFSTVGPTLFNVYGRTAGVTGHDSAAGITDTLQNAGIVWTEANLMRYMKNPERFVSSVVGMNFAGLPNFQDRVDIAHFLRDLTPEGEAGKKVAPQRAVKIGATRAAASHDSAAVGQADHRVLVVAEHGLHRVVLELAPVVGVHQDVVPEPVVGVLVVEVLRRAVLRRAVLRASEAQGREVVPQRRRGRGALGPAAEVVHDLPDAAGRRPLVDLLLEDALVGPGLREDLLGQPSDDFAGQRAVHAIHGRAIGDSRSVDGVAWKGVLYEQREAVGEVVVFGHERVAELETWSWEREVGDERDKAVGGVAAALADLRRGRAHHPVAVYQPLEIGEHRGELVVERRRVCFGLGFQRCRRRGRVLGLRGSRLAGGVSFLRLTVVRL
ncbi:cytochrome c2 precursor, putative [Babesia caballi]|uniref:Cytochrome c2, putative n=1 Tax=Babesia caballi TaxID=5871 RepID=A0AAV4LNH0_BABCB|nr:cytochrome c2 precursor, putative [Babesia caballi]